jgi:hypothetical protein
MDEQATNAVIQCTEDALGFPVLGRGVRTRKTQRNTMGSEMTAEGVVVEHFSIVRLNGDKRKLKLSAHISMKM